MTESNEPTRAEQLETLLDLTKDERFVMFTTLDESGTLVSRPMSRQQLDFDADMWFIATRDSRKVTHIQANPAVNLSIAGSSSWVSLSGRAEVVDNTDKLEELWNTFAEAWIPDGPQDPNAILIHVEVDTAEYWNSPGGRVASLISLASAKVTGKPYNAGDNQTVTGL